MKHLQMIIAVNVIQDSNQRFELFFNEAVEIQAQISPKVTNQMV